jgi:hypothetical protein
MTESHGDNLVIRTQSGEALASQPDLKERLEAAAAEAALPIVNHRPDGLEFSNRYRAIVERIIDDPNLNRERSELCLDLSATNSACQAGF